MPALPQQRLWPWSLQDREAWPLRGPRKHGARPLPESALLVDELAAVALPPTTMTTMTSTT